MEQKENKREHNSKLIFSTPFFPVLNVKKFNPLKIKELHYLRIKDEKRKNMLELIDSSSYCQFEGEANESLPKYQPKIKKLVKHK